MFVTILIINNFKTIITRKTIVVVESNKEYSMSKVRLKDKYHHYSDQKHPLLLLIQSWNLRNLFLFSHSQALHHLGSQYDGHILFRQWKFLLSNHRSKVKSFEILSKFFWIQRTLEEAHNKSHKASSEDRPVLPKWKRVMLR